MPDKFTTPETWYVYTYAYPDGTVFYVGKGNRGRIDEHEREARKGCTCEKCRAIRRIWDSGHPVRKRIVFETLVETEALAQERLLIKQYAGPQLTNVFWPSHDLALSANEAGKLLGVSGKTVIRMMEDNEFPGYRIGFAWKFRRGDIEAYRDSRRYRPKYNGEN